MTLHCNKHGIRDRSIGSAAWSNTYRLTASGCLDWFIIHMSPSLVCSHICLRMVTLKGKDLELLRSMWKLEASKIWVLMLMCSHWYLQISKVWHIPIIDVHAERYVIVWVSQCDYLLSLYNSQLTFINVNRLVVLYQWRWVTKWEGTGFGTSVSNLPSMKNLLPQLLGVLLADNPQLSPPSGVASVAENHVSPVHAPSQGGPHPMWRVHVGRPQRDLWLRSPNGSHTGC